MNLSTKIEKSLPKTCAAILKRLTRKANSKNLSLYLVGGFVRDILLDYPNLDLDFTIEGDALLFAQEIAKQKKVSIRKYPEFGTATLTFPKKIRVDLAGARQEIYPADAGLPEVSPGKIRNDLFRRDFTVNSMAIRVSGDHFGELVDPSGGLKDLEAGVIRVHHDRSFADDPTRIFRAIRFRTRYGFIIDPQTLGLIKEAVAAGLIEKLSAARIKNDIVHLLEDRHPAEALVELGELGVLRRIHRKFSVRSSVGLLKKIEYYPQSKGVRRWFVLMLAILYNIKLVYALEIAKNLRFTRRETESLFQLQTLKNRMKKFPDSPSGVYRFANQLSKELIFFVMQTNEDSTVRNALKKYLLEYRFTKLRVSGHDLEGLGIKEGPVYKEILDETLDAKLDRGFESKEQELDFIKKYLGFDR